MKRTLLVTLDFPPHIGGVARYYDQLSRHLPSDFFLVFAPSVSDAHEVSAQRAYDQHVTFRVLRGRFFWKWMWPHWLPLLWRVGCVVRKEHIEHVLVGQILPVGTVLWLLNLISSIGVFPVFSYTVMTHAMDVMLVHQTPRKKWLAKHILANAHSVTSVSTFTKEYLQRFGVVENRLHVLPPGVSTSMFGSSTSRSDIRKEMQCEDAFLLLSVGRLVERKGYDRVIQALSALSGRYPHIHYLIVGAGPYETALRALVVRTGLVNRVHLIGQVSDNNLPSYYATCDVFILPTRVLDAGKDVEGFGIVFLEAASFGKPVIAGNTGGGTDAVIDEVTGLLVDPENISHLATAIERLYTNPVLRSRFGEAGKKRVQEQFQWPTIAKKFEALLSS